MKKKAFTLIELIIVVSILGILAAIVIPQVQGNTIKAKESSALSSLRTLRTQIEMYKLDHDNVPAYVSGTAVTTETVFKNQLAGTSKTTGVAVSTTPATSTYPYGPYVREIPENPINGYSTVKIFTSDTEFADNADDTTGWIYKALTGEIRINSTATDDAGNQAYYEY